MKLLVFLATKEKKVVEKKVRLQFWLLKVISERFSCGPNTVKPLLSGHLRDLPKCPLNRGCPLNKGAMFVNDQHSTVDLYCLYCDEVAYC